MFSGMLMLNQVLGSEIPDPIKNLLRYKALCQGDATGEEHGVDLSPYPNASRRGTVGGAKACGDMETFWRGCSQLYETRFSSGEDVETIMQDVQKKLVNDAGRVSVKYYKKLREDGLYLRNNVPAYNAPGLESGKTSEGSACPSTDFVVNVTCLCVLSVAAIYVSSQGLEATAS
eukprot:GHVU01077465.1.p1 GENE.GHVU01077465.1~~GHVU01077465.1.p1  ORF type:complete len:174 (-),score=8.32 GHVU01077465.1:107-628(-)